MGLRGPSLPSPLTYVSLSTKYSNSWTLVTLLHIGYSLLPYGSQEMSNTLYRQISDESLTVSARCARAGWEEQTSWEVWINTSIFQVWLLRSLRKDEGTDLNSEPCFHVVGQIRGMCHMSLSLHFSLQKITWIFLARVHFSYGLYHSVQQEDN